MTDIKILVVEPDFLVRKGLVNVLNQAEGIKVIGEASNAKEAIEFVRNNSVDVVLTELWVKDEKNSLLTILSREFPYKPKIVVLTASQEAKHLFDAMRLGAKGYLLKSLEPEIWVKVIKSVVRDEESLSSSVACDILREFAEQLGNVENEKIKALTKREKEILHLVAIGFTNQEIGQKLNISPHTVKNHLKRINNKVGVNNRVQLLSFAIRHGFSVKST